jgi:hypothetical protein
MAMVRLSFCECFIMDAGHAGTQSMASSSRLTHGRFWMVLGYMLLVTAAAIVPFSLISAAADSLWGSGGNWEVQGILRAVLSVPVIYVTAFTFVFYKALHNKAPEDSSAPA